MGICVIADKGVWFLWFSNLHEFCGFKIMAA